MKTAVIAFVPVIHKGYLDFFEKNSGDIFVLGDDIIADYVHLTRDLRMIDPGKTVLALRTLFPKKKIEILDKSLIRKLLYKKIMMPDDEVCRDLALKYFKRIKVKYVSVFLRWNRTITFNENEVSAHRKITKERFHKEMIDIAEEEAKKSGDWWRQIAVVIVKDKKILFKAYNHHLPSDFHLSVNGDPRSNFDAGQHQDIYTSIHAEATAIANAAKVGISLDGAEAYVTTFPCPNCARLICLAGIKKVYYSKGYSLLDAEKILDHFEVEIILVK